MASVDWEKCKAGTGKAQAYMRHNFRENINYTNPDLDRSKSGDNIIYGAGSYFEAKMKYKDRLEYVEAMSPRLRSDRVQGIEIYFPEPKGLKDEDRADFFKKAYDALEDFFGKRNVIYGTVHLDEIHEYRDNTTGEMKTSRAHMHALVVPELEGRLCAKNLMTRTNFRALNSRMDDIAEEYGLIFQTGEQKKGVTVEELKGKGALLDAQREYDALQKKTSDLLEDIGKKYPNWEHPISPQPEPDIYRKKGVDYVTKNAYDADRERQEINYSVMARQDRELFALRALEPYFDVIEEYKDTHYKPTPEKMRRLLNDGDIYQQKQKEQAEERRELQRQELRTYYDTREEWEL